jgi:hypothetical protein
VTETKLKRDSWYRTYQRYLYHEDRQKTMVWLDIYISKALKILDSDLDFPIYMELKNLLMEVVDGLEYLCQTYSDDVSMQTRIKEFQTSIHRKVHPKETSALLYRPLHHLHSFSSPNLVELANDVSRDGASTMPISQSYPSQSSLTYDID